MVRPVPAGACLMPSSSARLGSDAAAWTDLFAPLTSRWERVFAETMLPVLHLPRYPILLARFGLTAMRSARSAATRFKGEHARALFGGMAAHSFLTLDH